jgi:TRAP-type C4-dicarboxylate transport system substrate-binding protein
MIGRLAFFAAALALAAASPALAQTKTIKLLSSWDRTTFAALEGALVFQEQVAKISGGKLEVDIKGPETVPPFQQIQPVSAGVFDMLWTHGVYHAGSKGLTLVVDAMEPDLEKRRSSGVFDYLDKYYQKNNKLTIISLTSNGTNGYQLILRDPLTAAGDFAGRKIRATQSYFGVIKALGGTPVVIPINELYSALEKGVVDGAAMPAAGILTAKTYEVSKYRVRPFIGVSTQSITVNMNAWGKYTADEQRMLREAGRATEQIMLKQGDVTITKEDAELDKLGMGYAQLPPDKAQLVKNAWRTSLWELAEQCCADGAKELHEIARKANLTD